jgi:hypothetical protein
MEDRSSTWAALFVSIDNSTVVFSAGEMSGASLLSQKAVSASPARNGVAGSCGSADQVGPTFLNSPVKERLSAFSAFSSPLRNRLRAPLQSAFARCAH